MEIPDKLYFKIGEIAALTGVKPHVLRYWESEFSLFRPAKSRTKQRLYRRKDIDLVLRLKDLLYNQGYTIAGARKKLREPEDTSSSPEETQMTLPLDPPLNRKLLAEIRQDIHRLLSRLEKPL